MLLQERKYIAMLTIFLYTDLYLCFFLHVCILLVYMSRFVYKHAVCMFPYFFEHCSENQRFYSLLAKILSPFWQNYMQLTDVLMNYISKLYFVRLKMTHFIWYFRNR